VKYGLFLFHVSVPDPGIFSAILSSKKMMDMLRRILSGGREAILIAVLGAAFFGTGAAGSAGGGEKMGESVPLLDRYVPGKTETATFALG
jgi:hypothetical protein